MAIARRLEEAEAEDGLWPLAQHCTVQTEDSHSDGTGGGAGRPPGTGGGG